MATRCHGYNATYTHRGFSFESALIDALMQVGQNSGTHILAGSFDELTPGSYTITRRLGLWKRKPVSSLSLLSEPGRGTLPGEGVAFFLLSGSKGKASARLVSVRTLFAPAGIDSVETELLNLLEEAGLSLSAIDLVILGVNGDRSADKSYNELTRGKLKRIPLAGFKHLCGEYDTASSFALWLAAGIIRDGHVPDVVLIGAGKPSRLDHILIYNHLRGINHSFMLVSSC